MLDSNIICICSRYTLESKVYLEPDNFRYNVSFEYVYRKCDKCMGNVINPVYRKHGAHNHHLTQYHKFSFKIPS